jgi:hypothetical protein
MGMFDTIKSERKLPLTKEIKKAFLNRDWSEVDFQTKDLHNTMSNYVIKKNGFLYTEKVEGEYVRTMTEKEEETQRKKTRWCWPYKFVESSRSFVKQEITQTINFYSYEHDENNNTWDIEWDAEFVKGKLQEIKLVKGEISRTAEENDADDRRWRDQLEAHERHPWTKTKKFLNKITFRYWSTFWNNVSKILYYSQQKLQKLQIWVIRNLA